MIKLKDNNNKDNLEANSINIKEELINNKQKKAMHKRQKTRINFNNLENKIQIEIPDNTNINLNNESLSNNSLITEEKVKLI